METLEGRRDTLWKERLSECLTRIDSPPSLIVEGRLTRMVGLTLEAVGCQAGIGSHCHIINPDGSRIEAEVVGFSENKTYLMPCTNIHGLVPNARVIPSRNVYAAGVGNKLLGRVLDGSGKPLDGQGPLMPDAWRPLTPSQTINPLHRKLITEPLDVGVRAINALLTIGRGQRLGLFASSGVGKSVLLGMMTRFTNADVTVVGLVGERGREVKEFTDNILGRQGMSRAVVVATPADNPPLMRIHGAMLATTIAEYFRDQGMKVLLLMDSLTRFAQAHREIALAIGEPPATKGYPPSVFAKLPQLVERAGNSNNGGSITAFYTVLTEGNDQQDPIADSARAILDGHIVLSRELADAGNYPAIDIEASISRALTEITSEGHQKDIRRFKQLYSTFRQNRDLISVGAYSRGSDAHLDEAVDFHPHLISFMQQGINEPVTLGNSLQKLKTLMSGESPPSTRN